MIVMGRRAVVMVVMVVMIFITMTAHGRAHHPDALDVVVRSPQPTQGSTGDGLRTDAQGQ